MHVHLDHSVRPWGLCMEGGRVTRSSDRHYKIARRQSTHLPQPLPSIDAQYHIECSRVRDTQAYFDFDNDRSKLVDILFV